MQIMQQLCSNNTFFSSIITAVNNKNKDDILQYTFEALKKGNVLMLDVVSTLVNQNNQVPDEE